VDKTILTTFFVTSLTDEVFCRIKIISISKNFELRYKIVLIETISTDKAMT